MTFGAQQTQAPFKRRRGTCTFSTPDCDYTYQRPKSFKRRTRSFSTSLTWQPHNNTFTPHDRNEMQMPASPKANLEHDHGPAVKSKPIGRSSLASNSANISLPLPEEGELKSRFLSMCSTLLDSYDVRNELIKKNERLQSANDELAQTLANRTGYLKQQVQKALDENDRLGVDLNTAQRRNGQFEEELAEARERVKQLELQLQQDFKQYNTQHEQDVKEYSKLEQDKIRLEMDLRDAKQHVDANKNRYELELRKRGEQAKEIQKKDVEINERNTTVDALHKNVAAKHQALVEKQQQVDDLIRKLDRTDDSLKKSLAHHRFVLPMAMNAQTDLAHAQHSLSVARDESDEYAFANIWALATVEEQKLRAQLDKSDYMLMVRNGHTVQLKAEKARLEQSLAEATERAENSTNAEKLSKEAANAEMDKLRGELKDLKKKYETAEAELNTWKSRYAIFEKHLAKTNSEKDALSKEKERLLNCAGELDRKLARSGTTLDKVLKLPGELEELKKKHATVETNLNFWKNACSEAVRNASESNTAKNALSKEKEQLLHRNGELERQIVSAKRKPESQAAGVQCELAIGHTRAAAKQCGPRCQAKVPSFACLDHVERVLDNSSLAAQVRGLYRDDASRLLEIRINGKILPHPQTKPVYTRPDQVDPPLDDALLRARISDVYRADASRQIEVRVIGVTILRPFVVPEDRMKAGETAQLLLDGPLTRSKTAPEEVVLNDKPWILSSITSDESRFKPDRYDLLKLPLIAGQDEASSIIHDDEPSKDDAASTMDISSGAKPALRHLPIGAPPAPDFMQGANLIRTRESNSGVPFVDEEVSKKPSSSPETLNGAGIHRLEMPKQRNPQPQSIAIHTRLEIPEQRNRQPHSVAIPTPVSSVQTSPRDSVLMTPRSPMEGEVPQRHRKRQASRELNNDQPPKRHAPSDPVHLAPKQPRNYDARLELRQDRERRVPPPSIERKRSNGGRQYDSYRPGEAPAQQQQRATDEDRERERRKTADCYGVRWR